MGEEGKLLAIFEKSSPSYELFNKYLSDDGSIKEMLFHNNSGTRIAFSRYVAACVTSCLRNEFEQSHEKITHLMNYLISILNTEVAKNWIKAEGYFYLLFKVIFESPSIPYLYNYLIPQ